MPHYHKIFRRLKNNTCMFGFQSAMRKWIRLKSLLKMSCYYFRLLTNSNNRGKLKPKKKLEYTFEDKLRKYYNFMFQLPILSLSYYVNQPELYPNNKFHSASGNTQLHFRIQTVHLSLFLMKISERKHYND